MNQRTTGVVIGVVFLMLALSGCGDSDGATMEDQCSEEGAQRCIDERFGEICQADEEGTLVWVEHLDCSDPGSECVEDEAGVRCVGSACSELEDACSTEGAQRCTDDHFGVTCTENEEGCLVWVEDISCLGPNYICIQNGDRATCGDRPCSVSCTWGEQRCQGTVIETCYGGGTMDTCSYWSEEQDCADTDQVCAVDTQFFWSEYGGFCVDPSCQGKADLCPEEGLARCQGSADLYQCLPDEDGCLVWAVTSCDELGETCTEEGWGEATCG